MHTGQESLQASRGEKEVGQTYFWILHSKICWGFPDIDRLQRVGNDPWLSKLTIAERRLKVSKLRVELTILSEVSAGFAGTSEVLENLIEGLRNDEAHGRGESEE